MNVETVNRVRITVDHIVAEVTLKPIRRLYLRVRSADEPVLVSAPRRMSSTAVSRFIRTQIPWIERQRAKLREHKRTLPPAYADGETMRLWGGAYPIERISAREAGVTFAHDRITLRVPEPAEPATCARLLDDWYRDRLEGALMPLVARWAFRLKVPAPRVRVRKMTTRWGSCSLRTRCISVNLELAKRPPACLEYIVVHELLHFIVQPHNSRFYALLDLHLPQWGDVRRELNTHPIGA